MTEGYGLAIECDGYAIEGWDVPLEGFGLIEGDGIG